MSLRYLGAVVAWNFNPPPEKIDFAILVLIILVLL